MNNLHGTEEFTLHGTSAGLTVNDFWRWAYSDLLNNTHRGVLAEFLVYSSMGFTPPPDTQMRIDWMPFDLTSPSGRKIEVKSAAYLQSWTEEHFSQILFDIAPKRAWSPKDGYSPKRKRNSDLYVFCVYTALTKEKSILNLDLWDFYVLATSVLDKNIPAQKKISLASLMKYHPVKTDYAHLGAAIESIEL